MKLRHCVLFTAVCVMIVADPARVHAQPASSAKAPEPSAFDVPASDEGLPGEGPIRRNDRFRSTWRDRRTHFAQRAAQEEQALVFLGDSITQGWSDDFRGRFSGVKLANRGISGDTTRGMLVRLEEDVIAINPKGVVMLMGTNDLDEQATEPKVIVGNIQRIVDRLKEYDAEMPVIVCQVMPSSPAKNRPAEKIREVNRLIGEAMKDEPQVTVLDTWTLFAGENGDAKAEEFPDLLHPNDRGYAKWAAALRPLLATHGFIETEPDSFEPEPGFESPFNGRDLTGWGYRPTPEKDLKTIERLRREGKAPAWPLVDKAVTFDGQTASSDGRYVAKKGRLIALTPPEGRRVQQMWTTREFPRDFVLRLEFRATPNADGGVFIREPQLQCRDYALAGPYKELRNYKPQDWNELEVTVTGGVARATCNGEVLEEKLALPATGPIGLEGDRGQMEYRRIRVREM